MILLKLVFLRRDIFSDGIREQLLALGLAVVRHGEIDVEGERPGVAGQTVEHRLSLAHLLGGQNGRNRVQTVGRVQCFQFQRCLLCGSFLPRLEVFAEANAVQT